MCHHAVWDSVGVVLPISRQATIEIYYITSCATNEW